MSAKKSVKKSAKKSVKQVPKQEATGSAEGEVATLVAKFTPDQVKLVASTRRALRKRLPTACEVVYEYRDCFVLSYSPSEHGYEGVLAIRGSAKGVQLYFNRGKELPDPEKVLQGSATQVRFVDVEGPSTLTRPEIGRLIDAAIANNSVPFAPSGRGSIVLRSSATKKRKRTT